MEQSRARRRIVTGTLGLVFAFQVAGIAINHPYHFAYYNLLEGNVEHHYELDCWDVSTVNAMRTLAGQARLRPWAVPPGRNEPFGITHGYNVLIKQMREHIAMTTDRNAPYLFYNATYADIYGEKRRKATLRCSRW